MADANGCGIGKLTIEESLAIMHVTKALNKLKPKDYAERTLNHIIYGNYTEDATFLGGLINIMIGIIGIDIVGDLRDLYYDISHFEWTEDHVVQTLIDVVAIAPAIGSIKNIDQGVNILKGADILKQAKTVEDASEGLKYLYGMSKSDVGKMLGDGWTEKAMVQVKRVGSFIKGINKLPITPGEVDTGGSYYSYSSGASGRIKIVGSDYIPSPEDKSTIIYMK